MRMSEADVERLLGEMSLRQKIGQMVMCGFNGTEISEDMKRLIQNYHVGGVIYFARNVESVDQMARLSADLQRTAAESGNTPLWISIDQEGGMVARITEGVALMPGHMAIAAAGSVQDAYEAAFISGQELKTMGINLNFAPVLDVNNNPLNPVIGVRSFGESPDAVAEYGAHTVRGLQAAGLAATAKHFPGHGDTDVDSHLDLPTVPHDRERVDRVELVPFRRAIAEGVDAVMSAHIYFPALEREKLPVTLSRAVLTGLLREELGFGGIIMTDCMEMNAIADHYGTVEAAVMAVEAGADLVLISHSIDRQIGALEALEQAVAEGRITEERINASVKRLLASKAKRNILGSRSDELHDAVQTGSAEHQAAARRISEASVTLVRDEAHMLPLKRQTTLVVTIASGVTSLVDEMFMNSRTLGEALAQHGLDVVHCVLPLEHISSRTDELLDEARSEAVKQIVVATYNAQFSPAQLNLVRGLNQLGKPLAVVAQRNPYDLLELPEVSTFIAAYESRPLALQSAAKALLGIIPFRGRLPVSLGDKYPIGSGVVQP